MRRHDGAHTHMATVPRVLPDFESPPPPVSAKPQRSPGIPVPWLQGTRHLPPTPLEGEKCHTQGPKGTVGLPLTIISRHVTSTFNACHSTTTPFDLNHFILYRR